jgi:hypothetical protein
MLPAHAETYLSAGPTSAVVAGIVRLEPRVEGENAYAMFHALVRPSGERELRVRICLSPLDCHDHVGTFDEADLRFNSNATRALFTTNLDGVGMIDVFLFTEHVEVGTLGCQYLEVRGGFRVIDLEARSGVVAHGGIIGEWSVFGGCGVLGRNNAFIAYAI